MAAHRVTVFRPYRFEPGEKIRIADGPRRGDWEVVAADDQTLTLRCPVSGRQFTWKSFCYLAEQLETEWPAED